MSGQGFAAEVQQFADEAQARIQEIFETVVNLAYESIVHGSAVTGSPGQPESTRQDPPEGHLVESWHIEWHGQSATIYTRHSGARTIEIGSRLGKSLVLRCGNGGFHSLALTRSGFVQLVNQALREIGELSANDTNAADIDFWSTQLETGGLSGPRHTGL